MKLLALSRNGDMVYCSNSNNCDHLLHQKRNESLSSFLKRVEEYQSNSKSSTFSTLDEDLVLSKHEKLELDEIDLKQSINNINDKLYWNDNFIGINPSVESSINNLDYEIIENILNEYKNGTWVDSLNSETEAKLIEMSQLYNCSVLFRIKHKEGFLDSVYDTSGCLMKINDQNDIREFSSYFRDSSNSNKIKRMKLQSSFKDGYQLLVKQLEYDKYMRTILGEKYIYLSVSPSFSTMFLF